MNHVQMLLASLLQPNQLGKTRTFTIGKVMQYAFLLILFMTIFSFTTFLNGMDGVVFQVEGLDEYLENIKWLVYPFAFLLSFIIMTILIFLRISLYAVVGLLFVRLLQRRAEYRQIWRTATYAMTWAVLLSVLAQLFKLPANWMTLIGIIITLFFLWGAITAYPKQKK